MAVPDPQTIQPWYLRNITQALALDSNTGNVYLRTDGQLTLGNVGNVIVSNVGIQSFGNIDITGNTLPVTAYQGTSPWVITGNANAVVTGNVNATVVGNIAGITALPPITGNVNANVTGNVGIVGNVNVTQGTSPWVVSGNVTANLSGNALPEGKPWQLQVAQGSITGIQGLSISGYQESVPTSWIPLWYNPTSYTYFPSAQQVRVWSSSASDTNVSVLISGLDASYNILTETVTLTNGATGVLTTGSFLRINSLALTRTPMNAGVIFAGSSNKAIELAHIDIGAGRSQMTIYTVPNGYTFYLTQSNVYTNQVGSQTGLYRSYTVNGTTGVTNIILTFPFVDQYNSLKVVPRPYPAKTDIQWQCQSSNGTSRAGAQIEGYLIATGY